MPIRYERDDARRRVVVTVHGTIEPDDAFAVIEQQRLDDAWSYGLLYDLRLMTGEPTVTDLRQLMSEAAMRLQGEEPRGPVVLLATDPALYGRLCTYTALGRSTTLAIEVFRDWDEAEQWLTTQTKAMEKDGA
jgi:hypothetical protein